MTDHQDSTLPVNATPLTFSSWLTFATTLSALVLALGTLVGVCLHVTGHIAHTTYLRSVGVPADLFPRSVEWTMINGYYAIFSEWTHTLGYMPWGLLLVLLIMLSFLIWLYRLPPPAPERSHNLAQKLPPLARELLLAVLGSAVAIATFITLFLAASLIALVPGLIGERAGTEAAEKNLRLFRADFSQNPPAEVWKQGELVARGHFIAVSTDLIALYNTKENRVEIIDRGGTELRSRPLMSPDVASSDNAR